MYEAYGLRAAATSVEVNFSTCCGARPTKVRASSRLSSSGRMGLKKAVRRIRSSRSLSLPCFLTLSAAWCERTPEQC